MDTIRKRFLTAEQDLLLAARSDTWALADFAEHWQKLQSDWESCLHEADDDTRQLANGVASRIEELARDFSDLESHAISLEDDLLNSIEDMFASLSLEDGSEVPTDLSTHGPSGGAGLPPSGHGVASPSQWLIHNLHNPYPLPHLQFSTGRAAGSKYMKDWFAKARQRIGWTRLLRDRFAGCRSLAIDAAFRAFVRDDPNNPLDSDLKTAFSAIKTHAEFVYGNKGASSQPSQKQSRSISPTPSLTFSSSSEDSDDERSSILSPERSYPRPLKRASFDSPHTPSSKRTRTHASPSSPSLQPGKICSPLPTELAVSRPRKRRLSESDSDSPRPKRPRGMEDGRLQTVSDPLLVSMVPTWFDLEQSFQIPSPASTDPIDTSSFDLDFFNPLCPPSTVTSSVPAPSADAAAPLDDFSALFKIPQLDLSQLALPTFNSNWAEFLNFEPDLSLFASPSLTSSLTSTPPLVDDAILTPYPSSPDFLPDILPHLSDKGIHFPAAGEPIIQGQDFVLPPGEDTGIFSVSTLLSIH